MTERPAPFLKWAGGKRWLAASPYLLLPESYKRYIEPFLGGGAMFFRLQPEEAILSDINSKLVNAYVQVRDNLEGVKSGLDKHQNNHCTEHYYSVRDGEPESDLDAAVQFIYLNRTCWNGLYRVNKLGRFNVPVGTKMAVNYENGELEAVSQSLFNAEIHCRDFEESIELAQEGDFLFVDPPYTVNHNMNGFLKYNENIFSWADQQRLRAAVGRAISRGAKVALTNADHASVRELYKGFGTYRQVWRASVLAGKATERGRRSEALFLANF